MSLMRFRRLSTVVISIIVVSLVLAVPSVFAQTANTVELVGTIEAMSANTITVNQQSVDVSTAEINIPLEIGTVVKVEGSLNQDGTIVARQVNGADVGIQPGEAEIIGVVESLNGTSLVINGQNVDISTAQIPANLAVGQIVKVHATATGANTWTAREVELFQPDTFTPPVSGEFEIIGSLDNISSGVVVISGQPISMIGAEVKDALILGTLVKAHVSLVNGQLTAREIETATIGDNADNNENLNDNGNANLNNNGNGNLNGNDNANPNAAITAQQAIDIVLGVYPTTTIRSLELTTKFDDILVWKVKIGNGIELNIDAQNGAILTIDRRGGDDNANSNGNSNGNGNDNRDNDNGNLNENGNDNRDDDNGNDNNDDHGGGSNDNDDNDDQGGSNNNDDDGNSGMGSDD